MPNALLSELKDNIRQQLEFCDEGETPIVCKLKHGDGYKQVEDLIIKKILHEHKSIAEAIVAIEEEFNINSTDQ